MRRMDVNKDICVKHSRSLSRVLAIVIIINAVVWACSIIALILIMQNSSSEKGLFPILISGLAVGLLLIAVVQKLRSRLG